MEWFILQLLPISEKKSLKEVIENIEGIVGKSEFFPGPYKISLKALSMRFSIFNGYIFIKMDRKKLNSSLKDLENSDFVDKVLRETPHENSKITSISNSIVEGYKKDLFESFEEGFQENQIVKIVNGMYKNLIGKIVCIYPDDVCSVQIELYSTSMLVKIPFMNMDKLMETDRTDNYYLD